MESSDFGIQVNPVSCEEQDGMILLLFALILSASVALVAMVVDHSKQSLALNQLQIVADSAALSAVKRLNGKIDGWQESKQAAVLAIKQSSIHGTTKNSLKNLALNQGAFYGDAPFSNHRGQRGKAGELEVTVRRGTYWWDPAVNARVFRSLEEISSGELYRVPTYMLANAVEVTMTLDNLATTFGRAMGFSSFTNLMRTAVAVTNSDLEPKVAPFAIPICELIRTTSVYMTAASVQDDQYRVEEQSKRTLLFTSADPDGTYINPFNTPGDFAAQQRQREGFQRFLVNQAHVYTNYANGGGICYDSQKTGEFASCTHTPIRGVMGVPSKVPGKKASTTDISNALAAKGVEGPLGQYFAPLEDLGQFDTDADAVKALSDFINDGGKTVEQTYFFGGAPKENFRGVKKIRQTPCQNNSGDPEGRPCHNDDPFFTLRSGWPTNLDGGTYQLKMLMDRRNSDPQPTTRVPLNFTNPNCHMDVPIDDMKAKVQTVRVMVIAPQLEEHNGKPIKYCDPEATFLKSGPVTAVPPVSESQPVIVGYVTAHLHDGNVLDLDNQFAYNGSTPIYTQNGRTIADRSPGELDILHNPDDPLFKEIKESAKQYAEEYNEWHGCVDLDDDDEKVKGNCDDDDKNRNLTLADIGGPTLGIPQALLSCFDFSELFGHPKFGNILVSMSQVQPKFIGFANQGDPALGIPPSDPEYCLVKIGDPKQECIKDDQSHEMVKVLDKFFDKNIMAKTGPGYKNYQHCIPILDAGNTDWTDPDEYTDLHNLKAGRGCGGMIGALAIEGDIDHQQDPFLFATGDLWSRSSPLLVTSN